MLPRLNAPELWVTLTLTTIHLTILLWGAVRFASFISFCQAANASGRYSPIKAALLVIMYVYAPVVVISVTFAWVGWDQDWWAANVFVWLPFVFIVLFLLVLVTTRNDISNAVVTQRKARSRLPVLPPPPAFEPPAGSQLMMIDAPPSYVATAVTSPGHRLEVV